MNNSTTFDWKALFVSAASGMNININKKEFVLFEVYMRELQEWNKKVNITSIKNMEDTAIKHFLDSLTVLEHVNFSGNVVDIGSGGGFPGIPIKIKKPDLEIVLIESRRKKANFLMHIIRVLGLEGIRVYNGRAEEYDPKGRFDCSVSRAFSSLKTYCSIALPLVKYEGLIVSMKGKNSENELEALYAEFSEKEVKMVKNVSFALPLNKGQRSIVVLKKGKCFT